MEKSDFCMKKMWFLNEKMWFLNEKILFLHEKNWFLDEKIVFYSQKINFCLNKMFNFEKIDIKRSDFCWKTKNCHRRSFDVIKILFFFSKTTIFQYRFSSFRPTVVIFKEYSNLFIDFFCQLSKCTPKKSPFRSEPVHSNPFQNSPFSALRLSIALRSKITPTLDRKSNIMHTEKIQAHCRWSRRLYETRNGVQLEISVKVILMYAVCIWFCDCDNLWLVAIVFCDYNALHSHTHSVALLNEFSRKSHQVNNVYKQKPTYIDFFHIFIVVVGVHYFNNSTFMLLCALHTYVRASFVVNVE